MFDSELLDSFPNYVSHPYLFPLARQLLSYWRCVRPMLHKM